MNNTPLANRVHIAFFGRMNSGKSTIINALTNQQVSIVSAEAGTTTDPVTKAIEMAGIGPVALIDTAGFDDRTPLGVQRIAASKNILKKTDIAVLVLDGSDCTQDLAEEKEWIIEFKKRKTPYAVVINKIDTAEDAASLDEFGQRVCGELEINPIFMSAEKKEKISELTDFLKFLAGKIEELSICGHLVEQGDTVLLVMPQDIQAPKGRLILPQVQTIRDLLENKCTIICCTADCLNGALDALAKPPSLIITDSQIFPEVSKKKPASSKLTSFSILFAGYKGDIDVFWAGAKEIDRLKEGDRILIAEACTHNPLDGDISREKLPALLKKYTGRNLNIEVVSGNDFPNDLSDYTLIIHCGACMFNRKYVLSKIDAALSQSVPITNYGIAMAHMAGISEMIEGRNILHLGENLV